MKLHILLLVSLIVVACVVSLPIQQENRGNGNVNQQDEMTPAQQLQYLIDFGYVDDDAGNAEGDDNNENNNVNDGDDNNNSDLLDNKLAKALKKYQHTWGLAETGTSNAETQKLMKQNRCGLMDNFAEYTTGSKWSKKDLTYKILDTGYPSGSLTNSQIDQIIIDAFKEWSDVSQLTFTATTGTPDIEIYFASGLHADGSRFDGASGVLAHAYYPSSNIIGGDAHFDKDENWTYQTGAGIDVFLVAVHEFGHSIGIGHSQVQGAIMYPYYGYVSNFVMPADDIAAVQSLYGANEGGGGGGTGGGSSFCTVTSIDAMFKDGTGSIYAIKDDKYAKINVGSAIASGYPRTLSFNRLPTTGIQGVVYLKAITDGCVQKGKGQRCSTNLRETIYFFKGSSYYRYQGSNFLTTSLKGKDIGSIASAFPGVPNNIDSVFTFDGTKIYFTKGDNLYRITRRNGTPSVDSGYPKSLSGTNTNLPNSVDAVFTENTKTYYLKGTQVYRITNEAGVVDIDSVYPKDIDIDLFGCSGHPHLSGMIDQLINGFITDISKPCELTEDPSHHFTPGAHITDLMQKVRLTRRYRLEDLIRRYQDRSIFQPHTKRESGTVESTWLQPSTVTLREKYYDLSMLGYMLKVTSVEEDYRYGANSFKAHYDSLYHSVMGILCGLRTWFSTKGVLPSPEEVTTRVFSAMSKKYSLPPDQHIQQAEELMRLLTLEQALSDLYLDLQYIHNLKM